MTDKINELRSLAERIRHIELELKALKNPAKKYTPTAFDDEKMRNKKIIVWMDYEPTITGFTNPPTVTWSRYVFIGNICIVRINTVPSTSDAITFTITAPIESLGGSSTTLSLYIDNGTSVYGQGYAAISDGSSIITLYTASVSWTASGNKAADFTLIYEI